MAEKRKRLWDVIAAQLRFLRNTDLREEIDELRPAVEWVIANPETLQVVRAAQKAGVKIAETLEAAMDDRATVAATLAEQARRYGKPAEAKEA